MQVVVKSPRAVQNVALVNHLTKPIQTKDSMKYKACNIEPIVIFVLWNA